MTSGDIFLIIFAFVFGAVVGSFLNVVIYRIPAGLSIVNPPSACPQCNTRLAWYDNVPILGWIWLRGKCRYCAYPISIQYPIIEALTASIFAAYFALAFLSTQLPAFSVVGLNDTYPIFIVHIILLAALLAATIIDYRHLIIPLEIPWFATAVAILVLPATTLFMQPQRTVPLISSKMHGTYVAPDIRTRFVPENIRKSSAVQIAAHTPKTKDAVISPLPLVSGPGSVAGLAGFAALLLSIILLKTKVLPRSFEELDKELQQKAEDRQKENERRIAEGKSPLEDDQDPDAWLNYAHARREVTKEVLFIAPPLLAVILAYNLTTADLTLPPYFDVLGGVLLGYLVAGGLIWLTRILGTLGFGKEAMGLGDVHLLAAVGAVCGWQVAVLAFFGAPFFGLTWAIISAGAAKLLKREIKIIPYGPHLAIASVGVMIFREPLLTFLGTRLIGLI